MKVLALRADAGGCAHYRIMQPSRAVSALDPSVQIEVRTDIQVAASRGRDGMVTCTEVKEDVDLIVFQRPLDNAFCAVIEQAQRQGIACVVELDDDFANVHPNNIVWENVQPTRHPHSNYEWVQRACELADLVTVSTSELLKYAPHGRGVVLPNYITEHALEIQPAAPRDGVTVGWSGTVQTHPSDLQETRPGVAQAVRDTDASFYVVGDGEGVQKALGLAKAAPFDASGWTPLDDYLQTLADHVDVGIVPLDDRPFNRAKCLDASTLVTTARGVLPINQIIAGDQVLAHGEWKNVLAVHAEPSKPGIEITTQHGRSIKLSVNHRLLVNGQWTEAYRIQPNDVLEIQPERIVQTGYVRCPWPPDGRKTRSEDEFDPRSFVLAARSPTVKIDEVWARYMGLFVGDGCASGKSGLSIACDGQDRDLIDMIADDIKSFGLRPYVDWSPIHRRAGVGVSSAHLSRFFESLGLLDRKNATDVSKGYRKRLRIPDVIWRSPSSVVAAFLSGLFEADGSAGAAVSMTTKSAQLARDVQHALLLFGIPSSIKGVKSGGFGGRYLDRNYYTVKLSARASSLFDERIGFLSSRKRDKMLERSARLTSYNGGRYGRGKPLDWTDRVISINEITIQPVDIQVDGEQFSAAGVTSHNSWLKGLEFAALGIPFVASALPEYRKLHDEYGIGMLSATPSDWRRLTKSLVQDQDLRFSLGATWREQVARHLTAGDHGDLWVSAWTRAIDHRLST